MKTLKKSNLEELAKIMPVLSEGIQRMCIGGLAGDSGDIPPGSGDTGAAFNPPPSTPGPLGSINNPYSMGEAEALMNAGHWGGGFVEGMGYMLPQLESTAPSVNKPPIPGFPNFGIQSPGTSGVTGYNPGDSGYTNTNGYGGPTGSFIGTGGGGTGGSGSGGGSSSSEFQGSYITGSACMPDDGNSNLYYDDTMSVFSGVAPGSTNEEIWEQTKYFYFREAKERGVDLYSRNINVNRNVEDGRAAYAWVHDYQEILLGNIFFHMYMFDRVAALIHESLHMDYDSRNAVIEERNVEALPLMPDSEIPDFVRQYAMADIAKRGGIGNIDIELCMRDYWVCYFVKSPVYYEQELNTYKKEIEYCPDSYVSSEYALERKYKLWKYELLLERSREIF